MLCKKTEVHIKGTLTSLCLYYNHPGTSRWWQNNWVVSHWNGCTPPAIYTVERLCEAHRQFRHRQAEILLLA